MGKNISKLVVNPINYLYIFATEGFISAIADAKTARIIRQKQANQAKLVNVAAIDDKTTYDAAKAEIRQAIIDQFGMTPAQILVDLAQGKNVAGKYWKEGVYGVGAVQLTSFTQDNSVKVDTAGKLLYTGNGVVQAQTPIYGTDGEITGYSATVNGNVFTSRMGADGRFYANTFGSAGSVQFADGTAYNSSKASSVWESIQTYVPMVVSLLQWILSLFGFDGSNLITYQNTYPSQDEFTYNDSKLTSGELLLLLGAGYLVYKMNK